MNESSNSPPPQTPPVPVDQAEPVQAQPGHAQPPRSPVRRAVLVAAVSLAAVIITLCFFCPQFVLWPGIHIPDMKSAPQINRAVYVLQQIDHPFTPVENISNRVITWRLLFPLIWHILPLPQSLFLAMPMVGCWLTLILIVDQAQRLTGSWIWSLAAAVMMAMMSWFFISTGWLTYNDSWIALALLVVAFSPDPRNLLLAGLLAPWIDERFILGLPVAVLARQAVGSSPDARMDLAAPADVSPEIVRPARRATISAVWLAPWIGPAVYLLIRLIAIFTRDSTTSAYLSSTLSPGAIAAVPWTRYADGLWEGLRAGWIFALAGIAVAFVRASPGVRALLVAFLIGVMAVVLVVAGDLSRAPLILLPWCLIGILEVWRWNPKIAKAALVAAIVINIVAPARHVVTGFLIPIRSLPAEIAEYQHPPPIIDSRLRTYYASSEFLAQNDFDGAIAQLNAAIASDPAYIGAYLLRGWVNAQLGRFDQALLDARRAIAIDPARADGWMIQGLVLAQRGDDTPLARASLEKAVQLGGPDFPMRAACLDALGKLK